MKMTFDYSLMKLYTRRYEKEMEKVLMDALMHGGLKWLDACLSQIPVWAGASHGTFLKIAAKLGAIVNISTVANIPGVKTAADGKSASVGELIKDGGVFVLEYKTSLWHLVYNEYNNANANPNAARLFARLKRPGPYKFQEAGKAAFIQVAKGARLPNPWKSMKIMRYRI